MFQKISEPIPQITQMLKENPGLVVGGELELVRVLQKLLIFMKGIGKSSEDDDPSKTMDYLHAIRLTLLTLEKTMGAQERSNIVSTRLGKEDLQDLARGLKGLLGNIRNQMNQLQTAAHLAASGVGNKAKLEEELQKREGKPTTTIQFTFDGLEALNKREGREVGDSVLQQLAKMIQSMVGDQGKVFQDGPGFVVVGDWDQESQVKDISDQVTHEIKTVPKGNTLQVVIGVVLNETENVLEKTHTATEKSDGNIVIYSEEVQKEKEEDLAFHQLAIQVLDEKNFYPEYQEIFGRNQKNLFTKSQRKFEVLWRSPEMSPFRFFGAIKQERRIHEVTATMLPLIFADIKNIDCEVAINITPEEMSETFDGLSFSENLIAQAKTFNIKLSNIIIELVEWTEEDHLSETSLDSLLKLKKVGCKLALDDYGARSSNLVRLMQLCENGIIPDFFKIDAALVKGLNRMLKDPTNNANYQYSVIGIKSIIELVKELRKETKAKIGIVAEFVDNQNLLKYLEKIGVTHFQGFYLGKPQKAEVLFKK